jgi:hypothetical protein
LDESHKLNPQPLGEGPRPKGGKSRPNLHGTILEGKSIGSKFKPKKKELERRAHDFKNKEAS